MIKGKTNLPYDLARDRIVVIQDVPAMVCKRCGECFVAMDDTLQVEKILATAKHDGLTMGFVRYRRAA